MGLLHYNSYLDKWKHKLLTFAGSPQFADHLQRSGLSYKDVKITASEMGELNATPKELLAAPGAGLVNIVEGIATVIDAGATPFECGSGTLSFRYTDGSGAEVATAVPNAQVESATDTYYRSVGLACVPVVNAAVVAYAATDVSAGDGTVYVRIWYRTVKVAEVGVRTEVG